VRVGCHSVGQITGGPPAETPVRQAFKLLFVRIRGVLGILNVPAPQSKKNTGGWGKREKRGASDRQVHTRRTVMLERRKEELQTLGLHRRRQAKLGMHEVQMMRLEGQVQNSKAQKGGLGKARVSSAGGLSDAPRCPILGACQLESSESGASGSESWRKDHLIIWASRCMGRP